MEKITKEQFNEIKTEEKNNLNNLNSEPVDIDKLLREMENPISAQKALAVKIKVFLDQRIEDELESKGVLSENTRRWVDSYNNILEKLQKSLHGDKSVNLHLHKVTHSDISNKIRESVITIEPSINSGIKNLDSKLNSKSKSKKDKNKDKDEGEIN